MTILFKNAKVVNVFSDSVNNVNVLVQNEKIIGVGDYYSDIDADKVIDCSGKYICPAFIDSHIHIESTKLSPYGFCKTVLPHGTVGVIADPHEITNVRGINGFKYMLEESRNLPMDIHYMVPSCVPASPFDESYQNLDAETIDEMLSYEKVIGLAEMMNYPGAIFNDNEVHNKIKSAKCKNMIINGHAPLLEGKNLDKYIASGIFDDHECSNFNEALTKLEKGQTIFIRSGSSSNNLPDLIKLFEEPYNRNCLLCTDDKDISDILNDGHMDGVIRCAIEHGVDPIIAIRMATIQAARYYNLNEIGAIAPGYKANFLILNDLNIIDVNSVYYQGKLVVDNKKVVDFDRPQVDPELMNFVKSSMNTEKTSESDFMFNIKGAHQCRVIGCIDNQLLTENLIKNIDFDKNNGVDIDNEIVKVAVIERHHSTGHISLGLLSQLHLVKGAIASTIGHDSHNIICAGTNASDMALAVNRAIEIGGGNVVVLNGKVLAELPLPIAGLMSDKAAETIAENQWEIKKAAGLLCDAPEKDPFALTAFLPLAVIPHLKITTKGYVDVDKFAITDFLID